VNDMKAVQSETTAGRMLLTLLVAAAEPELAQVIA